MRLVDPTPRTVTIAVRQCVEYFNRYADHFNLRPYIRFNTRVQLVRKADDYETTGRYTVTYQEQGKEPVTEQFDIVMVCSGHHWKPRTPTFKGLDKFEGHTIHSHAYKDQVGYENKHVLVVGVGNSGASLAVGCKCVLSPHADSDTQPCWLGCLFYRRLGRGRRTEPVREAGTTLLLRMPAGLGRCAHTRLHAHILGRYCGRPTWPRARAPGS